MPQYRQTSAAVSIESVPTQLVRLLRRSMSGDVGAGDPRLQLGILPAPEAGLRGFERDQKLSSGHANLDNESDLDAAETGAICDRSGRARAAPVRSAGARRSRNATHSDTLAVTPTSHPRYFSVVRICLTERRQHPKITLVVRDTPAVLQSVLDLHEKAGAGTVVAGENR
jgi:hypothetical protein